MAGDRVKGTVHMLKTFWGFVAGLRHSHHAKRFLPRAGAVKDAHLRPAGLVLDRSEHGRTMLHNGMQAVAAGGRVQVTGQISPRTLDINMGEEQDRLALSRAAQSRH
jgi:hypothetical protein